MFAILPSLQALESRVRSNPSTTGVHSQHPDIDCNVGSATVRKKECEPFFSSTLLFPFFFKQKEHFHSSP